MIRAPYIPNDTSDRRLHHLQTHHCAQIQLSTRQELMTTKKCRAYPQRVGNTDPMRAQQGLFNQTVRSNPTQAQRANPHNT